MIGVAGKAKNESKPQKHHGQHLRRHNKHPKTLEGVHLLDGRAHQNVITEATAVVEAASDPWATAVLASGCEFRAAGSVAALLVIADANAAIAALRVSGVEAATQARLNRIRTLAFKEPR